MERWNDTYPRPHLKRNSFISLNGPWTLNENNIIVPYPPQSEKSQYKGEIGTTLVYEKSFVLDENLYNGQNKLLLHFGAVDQTCEVYINHYYIGNHEGGYLPFTFDISLYAKKENILKVIVHDTLDKNYPYGKQTEQSHGMWYTQVSGIWQTVWMESVPENYIKDIKVETLDTGIKLSVDVKGRYKVKIVFDDQVYEETFFKKVNTIDFSSYPVHLWTLDHPYLYTIEIDTKDDHVESYFAFRQIKIKEKRGIKKVYINNKPVYFHGVLDQGYYPGGFFIPKDPQDYIQDIMHLKDLGFNTIRKHIKIENELFYYYCDKLGMFVIQDMVNSGSYSFFKDSLLPSLGLKRRNDRRVQDPNRKKIFIDHCLNTLDHLYHHPSVVIYTIFNEGWGQFDSDQLYKRLKSKDKSRLYDSTSGWFHQKLNEFESIHMYFFNRPLKRKTEKVLFLSECGGFVSKIEGHYEKQKTYGYSRNLDKEKLTEKIKDFYETYIYPSIENGLCGSIYTQLNDIEHELNGLYTFDREVCKVNKKVMLEIKKNIDKKFYKIV